MSANFWNIGDLSESDKFGPFLSSLSGKIEETVNENIIEAVKAYIIETGFLFINEDGQVWFKSTEGFLDEAQISKPLSEMIDFEIEGHLLNDGSIDENGLPKLKELRDVLQAEVDKLNTILNK